MKKIFLIPIIILILVFLIFFSKTIIKIIKKGNNMNNKSLEEITEYILNINSYEAEAEIKVKSNKTENSYKLKQKFIRNENVFKQEIMAPENIKGLTTTFDGTNLRVLNTKLNLNKFFENYNYIGSNDLSLIQFIEDFNEAEGKTNTEKNGQIILEAKIKNGNKYRAIKKLYIDKASATPLKLEIQDITQNTLVYILYNEIKINNLQKDDVIAFKLMNINEDI